MYEFGLNRLNNLHKYTSTKIKKNAKSRKTLKTENFDSKLKIK